jgi:tetratricopeptide (TPR) repeat protein
MTTPFVIRARECPAVDGQQSKTRAQELKRRADSALAQGRLDAAAAQYGEAACLDPANPALFYGLGVTAAAMEKWEEARQALDRADHLWPENEQALEMLARIAIKTRNLPRLKDALRATAQRFPGSARLHTSLGNALSESQQFDLALAEILRAVQVGETGTDTLLELAMLENATGDYSGAVREALAVEARQGVSPALKSTAAFLAGRGYTGLGQRNQAIEHLQRAIRTDPAQEKAYLALAQVYEQAEKYAEAADALEQRQRNAPGAAPMLLALGSDLLWAGEYERGSRVLEQLISHDPGEPGAYIRLAEAYRLSGQADRGIKTLRDLARRQPGYPMIHVLLAQAMIAAGTDQDAVALDELTVAEKASPLDPDIFAFRGQIYMREGRPGDAILELRRATELRPTDLALHYQLGLAYQRAGEVELARQEMERTRRLRESGAQK